VVTVLLCPGQGAQKVGMGRDLAERFPAARDTFAAIDDALGVPLSRLMWEGPEEELTLTHNAQPAILAHTCAVLSVVGSALGTVVAAAGHSLGEYSAYVAAGSLTPTDGARIVRRRGELMLEAGKARAGAMAAIIGLSTAEVTVACEGASSGSEVAVPANLNAPDQTVISGDPAAVARAGEACKAAGAKRVLPLKVSGAFHSPLMAPAVPGLAVALESTPFNTPRFPVIANATALPTLDVARARALRAEQVVSPVRWVECMQTCAADHPRARFLEIGPGSVLTGLLKRIVPGTAGTTLGTADEVEKFLAA
jgi:[acyl-carrier-protein] S-malonyltransferase